MQHAKIKLVVTVLEPSVSLNKMNAALSIVNARTDATRTVLTSTRQTMVYARKLIRRIVLLTAGLHTNRSLKCVSL